MNSRRRLSTGKASKNWRGGNHEQGRPEKASTDMMLSDLGIARNQSADWQQIATLAMEHEGTGNSTWRGQVRQRKRMSITDGRMKKKRLGGFCADSTRRAHTVLLRSPRNTPCSSLRMRYALPDTAQAIRIISQDIGKSSSECRKIRELFARVYGLEPHSRNVMSLIAWAWARRAEGRPCERCNGTG